MLGVITFIDGATSSFDKLYMVSISQLGEAGGEHAIFFRVGDPAQCDKHYKRMRSAERAETDRKLEKFWKKNYSAYEAATQHRIAESLALQSEFGVAADDLPCFLFVTPSKRRVGMLPLPRSWYDCEASWAVFLPAFCSWIADVAFVDLATADLQETDIEDRLSPMIDHLKRTIAKKLRDPCTKTIKLRQGLVPFPTPKGAAWTDVEIIFRDSHTISIRVTGEHGVRNYTQMGMADKRNGDPTVQWELLEAFANGHGTLDWNHTAAKLENKKRKSDLSADLRTAFDIPGDPFRLTDDKKGWVARFHVSYGE